MTKEQRYIISLSEAAVFGKEPELPPENTDWEYIWNKANEQNIAGLLADALLRLPSAHQPHNISLWEEALMQTMVVMGRKSAEFERMMAKLKETGIEPICLKGIVVKDLYPTPELRTMGDFDILLEKQHRDTVEQMFENSGYTLEKKLFLTDAYSKTFHWEIFVTLEEEFDSNCEYWEKRLRESSRKNKDGKRIFDETCHLIYIIVHTAKHFVGRGCGIRNLIDIALFIRAYQNIDFGEVLDGCSKCGVEKIFWYIASALEMYYGIKIPLEIPRNMKTELFVEYMLSYGVFGRDIGDMVLAGKVLNEHSDGKLLTALFPKVNMLKNGYPYLEKYRFLLPVAWIHRIMSGIFVKKYSVKDVIRNANDSITYGKERKVWLDKLEIDIT